MSGDSLQESVSDIWMSWKVSKDSGVNLVLRYLGILEMSGDSLQESVSDIWMSQKVSKDSGVNLVLRCLGILEMSSDSGVNLFLAFGCPGGV